MGEMILQTHYYLFICTQVSDLIEGGKKKIPLNISIYMFGLHFDVIFFCLKFYHLLNYFIILYSIK